jgi:hypothetical protein
MVTHRNVILITVACLILHATAVLSQSSGSLELTVSATRNTFLLGEPVVVSATVTNSGQEPVDIIPLLDPKFGVTSIKVKDQSGKVTRFEPSFHVDYDGKMMALAPGASVTDFIPLFYGANEYTFAKTGAYSIMLSYGGVKADELSIEIKNPANEREKAASQLMLKDKAGLFLLLDGAETLTEARTNLTTVTEQFGESVFADYARSSLSAYYAKRGRDFKNKQVRQPDFEKAESFLLPVVDKSMPPYFAMKNYASAVKIYSGQNNKQKADTYMKKLEKIYAPEMINRKIINDAQEDIERMK